MIQRTIALILLILLSPFFLLLALIVKFTSSGPFLFKQKRLGKNKRTFIIYKIRTMVLDAESLKDKYNELNQADGPVFKIHNDPRFTKIGKILSRTGLDELPQLINILKGEMGFIGPRPLPVEEAIKVPKSYQERFTVLPGITSLWVIKGSHNLTFDQWMKLDLEYIQTKKLSNDIRIIYQTIILILKQIFSAGSLRSN